MIHHISPETLHQTLSSAEALILVDIRENAELKIAQFPDRRVYHLPLSEINRIGFKAIPETWLKNPTQMVVFCHLGIRSHQFCLWLEQFLPYPIYNLLGGINGYTALYAPEIPRY